MSRPTPTHLLNDAIERYMTGEPFEQILTATGVSGTVLHRERTRRGIPPRSHILVPIAEIAAKYETGQSEYALSHEYNVSRTLLRDRLLQHGVHIRDRSEAGLIRASKMSTVERAAQTVAANEVWRGSHHSEESLARAARTREANEILGSDGELRMSNWLYERGVLPGNQVAIGRYNIDVAVLPIAVEIFGGNWHLQRRTHHAERTKYILDQGWNMLIVWDLPERRMGSEAADYVIAFRDEMRGNPTRAREYRVITGQGQFLSGSTADRYQFALEPPPRGRF